MDAGVLHPAGDADEAAEVVARARREIRAGIALVAGGSARTVRISSLPGAEHAAAEGLAVAQASGVALKIVRVERDAPLIVIGPRLDA